MSRILGESKEQAYLGGQRSVWTSLLRECLTHLGYDNPHSWVREREQAIAQLRRLCREFGDNDWTDDLHLGDIIEKHLTDHLMRRG